MKELEHIKKIESEVSRQIESARSKAEKKVSAVHKEKENVIKESLRKVELRLERKMENERAAAEAEAAGTLKASDLKLKGAEQEAKSNFEKAVDMVLGFLVYGRS